MGSATPELDVVRWFNSEPLTWADLRGKVVLVEAFQMLCPGCVTHSLPQAQRVRRLFPVDELAVIGLHTVFEHHDVMGPDALEAFLSEYRITFPVAVDRPVPGRSIPATMGALDLQGTPSHILLDRRGERRAVTFGAIDDIALGARIGRLLAEPADPSRRPPRTSARTPTKGSPPGPSPPRSRRDPPPTSRPRALPVATAPDPPTVALFHPPTVPPSSTHRPSRPLPIARSTGAPMATPTTPTIPGYTYGDADLPPSPVGPDALDELLASALWSDDDRAALRRAGDVLAPQAEAILDVWYGFVGSNPHLIATFGGADGSPDPAYLDAVRARFARWIVDLCERDLDATWLAYQDEIGRRHAPEGKNRTDGVESTSPHVPLGHLIALVVPITVTIRDFLGTDGADTAEVDARQAAWFKAVTVSVALWARAYRPDLW